MTGIHRFGGDWTSQKLEILRRYLEAYSQALKDQPFQLAYIDAFAGSGVRAPRIEADLGQSNLFPAELGEGPDAILDGSARMALQVQPGFDRYIFIEQNADRCDELRRMAEDFPERADRITTQRGEANAAIQELCAKNWHAPRKASRAVLFLDPYGLQVSWETIEAVASTRAIDLWLLFPLGMGVNRMLKRDGEIPEAWRRRLDQLLGTDSWYEAFYEVSEVQTLFGEVETHAKVASTETIARFFQRRLREVFPAVSDSPCVLSNSRGCPLYLFCFAAGNERGGRLALKLADHILKKFGS